MTSRPLRLAHRGDWRHAPENTLAAFAAALAVSACDGLEFDVRVSADDVPVVCHDDTLARVQGRPERVDALTAADLATLGVPTLAEVFALAGRGTFLDVELKCRPSRGLPDVLAAGRDVGRPGTVISSFEPIVLQALVRDAPGWPRWLNSDTLDGVDIDRAVALGCSGVAVRWRALGPGSVERARRAGLEVAAWTVRRRPTFERLARLGVVAVCVEAAALDG